MISRDELEEMMRSYKRLAGFDPETLNNRPSLGVAGLEPTVSEGTSVSEKSRSGRAGLWPPL